MDRNLKLVNPNKAANPRPEYGHDHQSSDVAIAGAKYSNSSPEDSDEEDAFVDCGEVEPMVRQSASNIPSRETLDRGTKEDQFFPRMDIQTSYDTIVITINGNYDFANYKIYYKDSSGEDNGSITRESNRFIIRYLRKNTEYTIEVQETLPGHQRHISTEIAKTLFCSAPQDLQATVNNNTVTFTWKAPLTIHPGLKISEYILEVCNYMNGRVEKFTSKTKKKLKISFVMERQCSYQCSLYAKAGDLVGCKVYWNNIPLKHRLCKISKPVIREKNRTLYLLEPNETRQRERCVQEMDFGDPGSFSAGRNENVMLLVGETGTGKTTWINAFVNHLFGVMKDDSFRFKLVQERDEYSQTESKTQCVTIYRLRHQKGMAVNYGITLIDTPGFGDTSGIERDNCIENEIHALFGRENGYLEHINAVAFVMPANASRLTPTMKYILDSILSLFGKNLKENLILLGTHGIAKPKNAIEALKGQNIKVKKSYHFENAEVLKTKYNDDIKGGKDPLWTNTMKMFKDLTTDLEKMPRTSVSQTQDVLEERERMKLHVANLRKYINDGVKVLVQFRKEHDYLQDRSKCSTTFIIPYIENRHIDDADGQVHNNCEKCKVTCHAGCRDRDTEHCIAMERRTNGATCSICINKCPWHLHSLQTFKIKRIAKERAANKEDIENRYVPSGKHLTREDLCEKLKDDFAAVSFSVKASISEIDQALTKLNKIALLSWPKSQIDYIDKLMSNERQQMAEGYMDRLELLDELKQEAKHLQSIGSGGKYDPFGQYREIVNQVRETGGDATQNSVGSGVKYDNFGQYREIINQVRETGGDATKTSTLAKYFGRLKSSFSLFKSK